jgi:hypothetical protein
VTGKAGAAHITAENHRRLNAGAFGSGRYILNVGSLFAAQIATANTVTIADGVLVMDGAQVEIEPNSPETVTIESAAAGTYRRDVIAVEYSKDTSGIETAELVVVAGTSASTAAAAARSERMEPSTAPSAINTGCLLWHSERRQSISTRTRDRKSVYAARMA